MDLSNLYPVRPRDASKGDHGWVLILAGSDRHAGVPALNALAALRAGADMVTVVAPRRAADAVAARIPEAITIPYDKPYGGDEARAVLEDVAADHHALVVGSGMPRTPRGHELVRLALEAVPVVPVVVDAAAVMPVAERPELLQGRSFVVTPNMGEMRTLAGGEPPEEGDEREEWVRRAAETIGGTVLLKGVTDYASDGERTWRDERSTPYMTKGGWGDTVAGVVGALLARQAAREGNMDPLLAAQGGVWLVGRAGEEAAWDWGEGLLPSDAINLLPRLLPRGQPPG